MKISEALGIDCARQNDIYYMLNFGAKIWFTMLFKKVGPSTFVLVYVTYGTCTEKDSSSINLLFVLQCCTQHHDLNVL